MSRRCPALLCLLWLWRTGSGAADDIALVGVGDEWRFVPGIIEPSVPATAWREPGFDDDGWLRGGSGFGRTIHGENTLLDAVPGFFVSAYFRRQFVMAAPGQVRWLTLRMDWQGGFVAFLNGREVLRRNVADGPSGHVPFDRLADFRAPGGAEDFDISFATTQLVAGTNVLAIQVHSSGAPGPAIALVPELLADFACGPMVLNVGADRADVVWRTPVPASGRVEFGPTPALGSVVRAGAAATGQGVRITGLVPGAPNYYRVVAEDGGREVASPVTEVRTLPTEGDLRIVLIGDSGSGSAAQFAIARQMELRRPDLFLHLGDVVYPHFTFPYADTRCLSVYRRLLRSTPFYFTWGNHDILAGTEPMSAALRPPTNDVPVADHLADRTQPDLYYSFDAGDAHFAVLFCPFLSQYQPKPGSPQMRWLERDLAATKKPWRFLLLHHPVMSSGLHRADDFNFNGLRDMAELADVLMPIAARHGVQAVFTGHDHDYERFRPIGQTRVFVTGGGGIGLYPLAQADTNSACFASRHHLTEVRLRGDTMRVLGVGTAGEVFDATEFRRTAPGSEDPDGDGLGNDMEAVLGTSPRDHDTDGDGLPDGWEWLHGLDPRSAIGPDGPGGDPDGDGMTNLARFLAEAPDDAPVTFVASRGPAGGIRLRWLGKPGSKAQLEAASTADGLFTAVPAHGPPRSLTSGTQSFEPPAEDTMRFFRMRLL